jgi:hypothetical protein
VSSDTASDPLPVFEPVSVTGHAAVETVSFDDDEDEVVDRRVLTSVLSLLHAASAAAGTRHVANSAITRRVARMTPG